MVRCYRGVAKGHVYYQEALRGIAYPQGGAASAAEHNLGETRSEYTSWTTSHQIALKKALESDLNGRGVVLQKDFSEAEVVASPDVFVESEVFILGLVTDALVIEVP